MDAPRRAGVWHNRRFMSPKPWSIRLALWLAVCTLLLKAAVPMLASASAQAQGKALVEVCTVYGVKMVALEGAQDSAPTEHAGTHGNEHCALTALLAFAAPEPAVLAVPAPSAAPTLVLPVGSGMAASRDEAAAWAARLRHGPPTSA
jgi:hypothetical protein